MLSSMDLIIIVDTGGVNGAILWKIVLLSSMVDLIIIVGTGCCRQRT